MNQREEFSQRKKLRLKKTQEMWQQMMKNNMKNRNLTPEDTQDRNKWSSRWRILVNPDEDQALKKPKQMLINERLCLKTLV